MGGRGCEGGEGGGCEGGGWGAEDGTLGEGG